MRRGNRLPPPWHPALGAALRPLPAEARGGAVLTPIRWFWFAAAIALVADLASKAWIFELLSASTPNAAASSDDVIWLLPGAFRLILHYNAGGAFGLASGKLLLFLGATAVLVPALVLAAYHNREPDAPLWGLGMIVGGAVGNLYDRLFHPGVRDFLEVTNPATLQGIWPVFNIADVAIVLGVVVYVIWSAIDFRQKKQLPPESQKDTA